MRRMAMQRERLSRVCLVAWRSMLAPHLDRARAILIVTIEVLPQLMIGQHNAEVAEYSLEVVKCDASGWAPKNRESLVDLL